MKRLLELFCLVVFVNLFAQTVAPSGISTTENYVYSRTYLEPVTTSSTTAKQVQSVGYFDGLGRAKQSIAIKATATGQDFVTTIPYDGFGRQVDSYFPAPMSTNNGGIQTGVEAAAATAYSDTNPFSHKVLENSPLDRIQQQIDPGTDWQNKPVNFTYEANDSLEVKKYTATSTWVNNATSSTLSVSGSYAAATLYKNTVTDEDGNVSIEFKNGQGQTLLVRKNDGTNNIDTYYVYNEYNQLAFVVPPLAAANTSISQADLDNLCYQYRYDGKNRLAEKKLPGKGWEYMVYDQQNRLVLTQDANLRTTTNNFLNKGWLFTKYDQFGRVVYTGFFKNTATRSSMQTALNNMAANAGNNEVRVSSPSITLQGLPLYYSKNAFPTGSMTLLSVNYYDTYPTGSPTFDNVLAQSPSPNLLTATYTADGRSTKSLPLASFVKNIETDDWTKNYSFYDTKARAFATYSFNHLGGYTKTESELDFAAIPQKTFTFHKRLNADTEVQIKERFEYNAYNNALEKHYHQVNSQPEELLTENHYNELGQLEYKNVGNLLGSSLQKLDYKYNIRGWMTQINDPVNLGTKLFGYKIKYNNVDGLQIPNTDFANDKVIPKYNGNIAEVDWKTAYASNEPLRRYGYVYDGLNRLTAGYYQNAQNPSAKEYFEHLLYDSNGNITQLKRSSAVLPGNTTADLIDNLTYSYTGNQLQTVADAQQNSDGYPYKATPNLITYDANGNMTSMQDKGINVINYNYLNVPNSISKLQGATVFNYNYIYRADGVKLNKITSNNRRGSVPVSTDYLDGFQYQNQVLQFIPTAEGYYDFTKNAYIYNSTDHLGNVRLSYSKNPSTGALDIIEENNYYAFGLKHEGYNDISSSSTYNYKYNGKELQETGMYAMDFRQYMPDIGRFTGMDALSEMYADQTPYHFSLNNPANFSDPTGLYTRDSQGNVSTSNKQEISDLLSYFKGGGSINGVDNFISGNSNFAQDLEGVVMQGKAGGGTGVNNPFGGQYGALNSAYLDSGINNARQGHNFQQAQYTLTEAVTETKIGQSVAGVENFLFRDIPLQFAGGSLLSAGWRAAGAGKFLLGVANNLYARFAPKVLANFSETGAYSVYHGLENGVVKYVGITGREEGLRWAEHRAAGGAKALLDFRTVGAGLTKSQARSLEQSMINKYGLPNLYNKINSIAPKNWTTYGVTAP
ncbi:DUF6443 domain-containing protein [Halpernia sp.]|uniref:DUF6443 domain-containing protein n=1 Tax=Halpernia sp. TaxID=2782209 RepID=UPI003A918C22